MQVDCASPQICVRWETTLHNDIKPIRGGIKSIEQKNSARAAVFKCGFRYISSMQFLWIMLHSVNESEGAQLSSKTMSNRNAKVLEEKFTNSLNRPSNHEYVPITYSHEKK